MVSNPLENKSQSKKQIAIRPKKRVLIGSPIRQKPAILHEFLDSLIRLQKETFSPDYCFIDDNIIEEASQQLQKFAQTQKNSKCKIFIAEKRPQDPEYLCDDKSHYWKEELIWKVADFKDRIIQYAREQDYDYLFLIDSDLVLHPKTIEQLISDEKEIVCSIYWSNWLPNHPKAPQVWLYDDQKRYDVGIREELSAEEIERRQTDFFQKLKTPGLYQVGAVAACTLINKTALKKGISFKRIKNITFWGEDIHFCIRATALDIPLFVDTHYPAFHIYRDSDFDDLKSYKENPTYNEREQYSNLITTSFGSSSPLVSIIVPIQNPTRFLLETMKSLINQTHDNLEIIIVNDGGTDIASQLDSLNDERIVYIQHQSKQGIAAARNSGIRIAKGQYIAYLNDQALYLPHHIQTNVSNLENSWFKVGYSDIEYAFKGWENDQICSYGEKPASSLPFSRDKLIIENQTPIISIIHEKTCLDAIGLFDVTLDAHASEWDLLIRLSKLFPFRHITSITVQDVTLAEQDQPSKPWCGKFLHDVLAIHAHYLDEIYDKSQIKLAKKFRDQLFHKALSELEQMTDEQLEELQPQYLIQQIAESSLLNTVEDIRNARALCGYLTQHLPGTPITWRVFAKLSRVLGDFRTAAIAISRALNYGESEENLQEYHLIVAQQK